VTDKGDGPAAGRRIIDRYSLTVQMVLSFAALALLTAAAVGLPAIILIRNQVNQQAWAQLSQGIRATHALYEATQSNVRDLATLTGQRPTLRRLLAETGAEPLAEYLAILRSGTDLDLLGVCDSQQRPLAWAGESFTEAMCAQSSAGGSFLNVTASQTQIWLLATEAVEQGDLLLGHVVAGIALNDDFVRQMKDRTGLEHTLIVGGQAVASSFPSGAGAWSRGDYRAVDGPISGAENPAELRLDSRSYFVSRITTVDSAFDEEVALDIAGVVATERRLVGLLVGSIVLVALFGSVLGVFLARRVGMPLTTLARAADRFSTGELDRSVHVEARVREVSQLAQALENARVDLQRYLTELRQAKIWNDNLMEAIHEGIATLDQDGHITFFSPGAERILGLSQEEVLHRHCDEVFRVGDADEKFSRHLPTPDRQVKSTVILDDGRAITLSLTGARLVRPESATTEMALVFRDVSEAELVHRFMGEFLANITHEFRTPVTALAASTELLLDQADHLAPAELRNLLNSLYMGIVGLQTLVDNLLESSRLEAGRFRVFPRVVELGEIVADATHVMQPLLNRRGQRLVVELPGVIPVVQADSRRITQVLVNLLSNANKYSPDDTEIALQATIDGEWVRIAVLDDGPGISSDFRPSLFRRFVRPEPGSGMSRYGAGLGLPVVKAIVEAHGGQVGADDRPAGGSEFWFTLARVSE
jgi:PAS domain S-box-containing protein